MIFSNKVSIVHVDLPLCSLSKKSLGVEGFSASGTILFLEVISHQHNPCQLTLEDGLASTDVCFDCAVLIWTGAIALAEENQG